MEEAGWTEAVNGQQAMNDGTSPPEDDTIPGLADVAPDGARVWVGRWAAEMPRPWRSGREVQVANGRSLGVPLDDSTSHQGA